MARLRFQRTLCIAAAAMAVFDGLVALWPELWRQIAGGDLSHWGAAAYIGVLCLGPVAAVIVLRRSWASRIIVAFLFLCFLNFVARFYTIETDPLFDRDLRFIKIDPFLVFYVLMFGGGSWIVALLSAPFVLMRRPGSR